MNIYKLKKTLVIFAHPHFEYSHANVELIKAYDGLEDVDFKDLYEEYPDFHIASFKERKRIRNYERLVFHFPLIWFTCPPLLKLWIDEVFDIKWLTETDHPLVNKDAVIIVTIGGKEENYSENGLYETTVSDLMKFLTLSLKVNNITVKKILAVHNADELDQESLAKFSNQIQQILQIP